MPHFTFHRIADKSEGTRIVKFDPDTGERKLVNPATPGDAHESWPLAGVEFVGEPPDQATIPTKMVAKGVSEGWIERVNPSHIMRPAGPTQDVMESGHTGNPHFFTHCDEIVFKMADGNYRYRVVHQPDKYAVTETQTINAEKNLVAQVIDAEMPVTPEMYAAGETRVDNFYGLERIDG